MFFLCFFVIKKGQNFWSGMEVKTLNVIPFLGYFLALWFIVNSEWWIAVALLFSSTAALIGWSVDCDDDFGCHRLAYNKIVITVNASIQLEGFLAIMLCICWTCSVEEVFTYDKWILFIYGIASFIRYVILYCWLYIKYKERQIPALV